MYAVVFRKCLRIVIFKLYKLMSILFMWLSIDSSRNSKQLVVSKLPNVSDERHGAGLELT